MSKPTNTIKKKKKERKHRIEKLRKDTDNLIENLNGNSPVKNALRKLNQRIQRLENQSK